MAPASISAHPAMAFQANALIRSMPQYVFWELEAKKRAHRAAGRTLLDLGIGSPDQPVPTVVVDALKHASELPELSRYPVFRGHPEFLRAAAGYMLERFGVASDPEQHYMSVAGSKEGLAEVIFALCEPGDVVLVPEVHYPVYVRAAQLAQAEAVLVPFTADGRLDVDAVPAEKLARARILITNYPCNPTTATIDLQEFERLVDFARANGVLLISDLAYAEIGFDGYRPPSALEVLGAMDCVVELHTTSKSFNMASFRVGFVVGNARVINALDAYRSNTGYGVATLPQLAAAAAFREHASVLPGIVAEYQRRRDALVSSFNGAGWTVTAPKASMYLWLPTPGGMDDWEWVDTCMTTHGVVLTPGLAFGAAGAGRFRISLVQPADVLSQAATKIASGTSQ